MSLPLRLVAWTCAIALVLAFASRQFSSKGGSLTVYCAHDSIFADLVFKEFTKKTGIRVDVKYDTEATKSLGLVEQLLAEKEGTPCDVFWNNEVMGTLALQEAGRLESGATLEAGQRMPAKFKSRDGSWCGFGGRLRVWITTNQSDTAKVPLKAGLKEPFWQSDLSRFALAKPLYGTTFTHFCALWQTEGEAAVRAWYESCRGRNMQVVQGNAAVKDLVAAGVCDLGWTDTDDAFAARDAGKAVGIQPVELPNLGHLLIPNTVAVMKGCRHRAEADRLVAFLLSPEGETLLAKSPSRQLPLGSVDEKELPAEVRELMPAIGKSQPLEELAAVHAKVRSWLREISE